MTAKQLYEKLDAAIPRSLSEEWDNDGLMVEANEKEIKKVLVTLDATLPAIEYAAMNGFDCIVTHHPLIFRPLGRVTLDSNIARRVMLLINNGISVMSFHTRLDKVGGGVNDALAARLGLKNTAPLPSLGVVGELAEETPLREFSEFVRDMLSCDSVRFSDARRPVRRVAVVGGSGDDLIPEAIGAGADTFVTGEGHHNTFADAAESGINYVVAGHYETEDPVCERLVGLIKEAAPDGVVEYFPSKPHFTV